MPGFRRTIDRVGYTVKLFPMPRTSRGRFYIQCQPGTAATDHDSEMAPMTGEAHASTPDVPPGPAAPPHEPVNG